MITAKVAMDSGHNGLSNTFQALNASYVHNVKIGPIGTKNGALLSMDVFNVPAIYMEKLKWTW